jgi:hypothetical protein
LAEAGVPEITIIDGEVQLQSDTVGNTAAATLQLM